MEKITFIRKLAIGVLLYFCLTTIYLATNYWTLYRHAFLVHTSLENKIPFIPNFVYIYILGFVTLLSFPIFFIKERKDFTSLAKGLLWIIISSGLIFCIFPTTTLRPTFNITDKTTWFLAKLYQIDPPNNCFPSLHVSLTAYIAIFLHRHQYFKNYSLIICFLVTISTLFIKEHAIIDVIGGLIYSYVTLRIFSEKDAKITI